MSSALSPSNRFLVVDRTGGIHEATQLEDGNALARHRDGQRLPL